MEVGEDNVVVIDVNGVGLVLIGVDGGSVVDGTCNCIVLVVVVKKRKIWGS
jgi:hypothetical protein